MDRANGDQGDLDQGQRTMSTLNLDEYDDSLTNRLVSQISRLSQIGTDRANRDQGDADQSRDGELPLTTLNLERYNDMIARNPEVSCDDINP
jgi:hypothetical protein